MSARRNLSPLLREYGDSAEMGRAESLLAAPSSCLGGFAGASLAFFLSAWKRPGGPGEPGAALVVAASQEEATEIEEELGALSVAPVMAFPPWESLFLEDSIPDGDIAGQRLRVLESLQRDPAAPRFVVAPIQAILQPVPPRSSLVDARIRIAPGVELDPAALGARLAARGVRSVPLVQSRGEFSSRGDVFDVFPWDAQQPLRIELLGDTVESIREFQADTQRSVRGGERSELEIVLPSREELFQACFRGSEPLLTEYLGDGGRVFLVEAKAIEDRASKILANLVGDARPAREAFFARVRGVPHVSITALPAAESASDAMGFHSVERFRGGDLGQILDGIRERADAGFRFRIWCESQAEASRFHEILGDHGIAARGAISTEVGPIRRGFDIVALRAVVLTSRELFHRHIVRRVRRRTGSGRAIQSFLELEKGDVVVYLVHGVGRYLGIESFPRNDVVEEFLAVEFRDGVKVYVPVTKIDLVQKYIGAGDRPVVLDRVGGTSWARKKEQVERALLDLASDLVDIQARREARPGFAFPEISEWQREFEAAFPFEETPDQVEVTAAIHADMGSSRPMDRLLCGDVGYGKTELAMRATFRAVDAGKQVAVLVPTTVLAQQHYRTFTERMSGFPIRIEVLSRFRTGSEQRETIERAASGGVDVLIGTHRILSEDVTFRDLGLVIIDEEQRFGVTHKEKLKRMRSTVEVLTLTATPIPRTLHMALLGIRDISSLTTAPEGRCPVRTDIIDREPARLRENMLRELNRDGQVYFVHNRIEDIDRVVQDLERVVPEARIDHAHGQMDEHELEEKMLRFFEGDIDCLVCTTIIENGLDIPNVNTIFIDEADRYGLADLHQLRGRVGRYKHQAYCYLLLPDGRSINPEAQRRLQALVEFSELGAGFQIAMRDLEIRGAGNILGPEQSGHIAAVGYDMYCRLLEKAVRSLKEPGRAVEPETPQVEIDLAVSARVPEEYRPGEAAKIAVYRKAAAASTLEAVADLERELEDRFGSFPREVSRLLDVQRLRVLCASNGIAYVGRDENNLILKGTRVPPSLLEKVPFRVAVLDGRTVAIPLVDPRRRHPPRISDENVFQLALDWLRTGEFRPYGAAALGSGSLLRGIRPIRG